MLLTAHQEILSDISDLCDDNLENNKLSSGYHILCNIRDFMSDRAKTNIAFTQLLIQNLNKVNTWPSNLDRHISSLSSA
jgi:hypothetical protein